MLFRSYSFEYQRGDIFWWQFVSKARANHSYRWSCCIFMPFVLSILTPQKNFRHGSETQLIIFLIGAVAIICVIFVLFLILQWSQLFHAVRIQRMKGENFTVSSETLFFHILLSLTFVGGNLLVLKAALYR